MRERHKTFARERKEGGFTPREGSFEVVQLILRRILSVEFGTQEDSYWIEIEEKAGKSGLSEKQAVFQFYLSNKGHKTLSDEVINSFPNVRASAEIDVHAREERNRLIQEGANILYDYYPEKYKNMVER